MNVIPNINFRGMTYPDSMIDNESSVKSPMSRKRSSNITKYNKEELLMKSHSDSNAFIFCLIVQIKSIRNLSSSRLGTKAALLSPPNLKEEGVFVEVRSGKYKHYPSIAIIDRKEVQKNKQRRLTLENCVEETAYYWKIHYKLLKEDVNIVEALKDVNDRNYSNNEGIL
jgi:hypothetical protein